MLTVITKWFTARTRSNRHATVEGWTLFMGREAAELWLDALKARDAAKLSNA